MRSDRTIRALTALMMCLLLSGCSTIHPNAPVPTLIPGEPIRSSSGESMRAFTRAVGMYYPQEEGLSLQRRTAEIVCEEGMWLPEVLVRSLLEPVDDPKLITPFGDGAELKYISSCSEMLIVEIDYADSLDSKILHASALALARTLIQETGAESVLLLKNGARVRLKGTVANPISALVCEDESAWEGEKVFLEKGFVPDEFADSFVMREEKRILYYPDVSGSFILCRETEDWTGRMTRRDMEMLLNEKTDPDLESLADRFGLSLDGFSRESLGDGKEGLYVSLRASDPSALDGDDLRLIRGILFLNMRINDRTLSALSLEIDGEPVREALGEDDIWYEGQEIRAQFGEEITLYFLDRDGQDLIPVSRTVSFSDSLSPEAWMRELLKGPDRFDPEEARGVFPPGIGQKDLLHVETDGVNAVVNFSSALESFYPVEDETMERMMVYSIVNTLTEDAWVKQVLIHVDGRQVDNLGGRLYLGTPLMRNPGLIRITEENQ